MHERFIKKIARVMGRLVKPVIFIILTKLKRMTSFFMDIAAKKKSAP